MKIRNPLLLLMCAGLCSCVQTTPTTTTWSNGTEAFAISGAFVKNVVQIYDGDEPLGSGVSVGDGGLVLTAIDYMDYSPGPLKVIVPGQGSFNAAIQSIDPRTSVTLIKMSGYNLPGAALGDSSNLNTQQKVIVCEWLYNSNNGNYNFQAEHMLVGDTVSDLQFNMNWTTENMPSIDSGAVVFTESGEVLGIVGVTLGFVQGPHIPPVVDINSAKDLISGNTEQQPWYKGPTLLYALYDSSSYGYIWGYPGNYAEVTLSINNVIHMGIPVSGGEPVKNMSEV